MRMMTKMRTMRVMLSIYLPIFVNNSTTLRENCVDKMPQKFHVGDMFLTCLP